MKVGQFKRITFSYGDGVAWYVTTDGDKLIDMKSAQVQNLEVTHLVFLEKSKAIVLYVDRPNENVFLPTLADEIAYRLHINAGELKQALLQVAGISLDEIEAERSEKRKTTETQQLIRKQLSEMAKSGPLFTSVELQSQMEQMVSAFQQPQPTEVFVKPTVTCKVMPPSGCGEDQ